MKKVYQGFISYDRADVSEEHVTSSFIAEEKQAKTNMEQAESKSYLF
jgi:hypothetical protein